MPPPKNQDLASLCDKLRSAAPEGVITVPNLLGLELKDLRRQGISWPCVIPRIRTSLFFQLFRHQSLKRKPPQHGPFWSCVDVQFTSNTFRMNTRGQHLGTAAWGAPGRHSLFCFGGHVEAPLFQLWPMCHLVDVSWRPSLCHQNSTAYIITGDIFSKALFDQFESQKMALAEHGAVRRASQVTDSCPLGSFGAGVGYWSPEHGRCSALIRSSGQLMATWYDKRNGESWVETCCNHSLLTKKLSEASRLGRSQSGSPLANVVWCEIQRRSECRYSSINRGLSQDWWVAAKQQLYELPEQVVKKQFVEKDITISITRTWHWDLTERVTHRPFCCDLSPV